MTSFDIRILRTYHRFQQPLPYGFSLWILASTLQWLRNYWLEFLYQRDYSEHRTYGGFLTCFTLFTYDRRMRTCSSATVLIPAIGMDAQMMADTWPASLTNIVNSGTEWLAKILRGGSLFLCTRRMGLGSSADRVAYWSF